MKGLNTCGILDDTYIYYVPIEPLVHCALKYAIYQASALAWLRVNE
jgi:hypothetical protein